MIAQTKPSPPEAAAPEARERRAIPIQAVRGMNDVLPDEAALWERFEDAVREVFGQYGYRNLRVPVVEATPLFVRAIGEVTDVVEHEMYTFEDRLNGESLTLRPEATAGIVRAAIEHNLTYERPQRVWTAGPMFRHERPQKGRYRQFHQFDVEALGFAGPDVDAEQIVMLARLWRRLGLDGIQLEINSIGDAEERRAHRAALIAHFERHRGTVCHWLAARPGQGFWSHRNSRDYQPVSQELGLGDSGVQRHDLLFPREPARRRRLRRVPGAGGRRRRALVFGRERAPSMHHCRRWSSLRQSDRRD